MANQILKKYIGDNQIDQEKILLDNDGGLKSKNAAGNAEVDLIKLNSSNEVVITGLKAPSSDSDASTKKYVDDHMNDSTDAHDASAISVSPSGNLSSTDVQAALQEIQGELDGIAATYVNVNGDTMTDALSMGSNKITNLANGTNSADAVNKSQLDSVSTDISNHINDSSDAHDASAISVSASGNLGSTDVQAALGELQGDIDTINNKIGAANGIAPLNGSSKIDSTYLPSYVDDVLEYANLAAFPVTGETGKIYVAQDNGKVYRWSGSAYIEVSPSEVNSVNGAIGIVVLDTDDISEGSSNKYYSETLFNSSFSGKDTDDLSEGTSNLYYTQARFDSALSAKDTDDLSEGTTNKYFTEQRAKDAAVSNTAYGSGWDGVNDVAPSKNAVYDEMQLAKGRLDSLEAVSPQVFKKTLNGTDISNQYIDLPYLAIQTNDFHVFVDRLALHQGASEDYTLSTVSGVTRITFLNDMLSAGNQPLASGDSIYVRYKK